MNRTNRNKYQGFSLIEIMISMTIGSILIAGVTSAYVSTVKNSADNIASIRLEQDLQAIVQLITGEMRRVGFDGDAANGGDTNFGVDEIYETVVNDEVTAACIRYSYDMGDVPDGTPDPANTERFGFRLDNTNKTVQFGRTITSCTDGTWTNINNPSNVLITAFSIQMIELCVNIKNGTNCNSSDSPTPVDASRPYVAPIVGDQLIKKYQLVLNITGQLTNDDSYQKSIIAKIRLLNDIKTTKT